MATHRDGTTFRIENLEDAKGEVCRAILQSLPDWFGIPEAIERYVLGVEELPFLVCRAEDGSAVGFLALKRHTTAAVEAYVLGVRGEWHRRGCGRLLFEAAERVARNLGAHFLTVKTLADSCDDPHYKRTRLFYEAVGFRPIEVFPTIWAPEHPCLFMLKVL